MFIKDAIDILEKMYQPSSTFRFSEREAAREAVKRLREIQDDECAVTRIEDMTNGNSAEREAFERSHFEVWAEGRGLRCDRTVSDSRYCSMEVEHAWQAWSEHARLSVCADGGKGEAVAKPVGYAKQSQLDAMDERGSALLYSIACPDEDWDVPVYLTAPQAECAPRAAVNVILGPIEKMKPRKFHFDEDEAPRADLTSNERYRSQMVAICAVSGYTYTAGASERADYWG